MNNLIQQRNISNTMKKKIPILLVEHISRSSLHLPLSFVDQIEAPCFTLKEVPLSVGKDHGRINKISARSEQMEIHSYLILEDYLNIPL